MSPRDRRRAQASASALALVSLVVLSWSCSKEPAKRAFVMPEFAVRGRWPEPLRLTYRIDSNGSPIAAADFAAGVDRAVAVWNATDVVHLLRVDDGDTAAITLAFRRGHHGACEPFNQSSALAHSGPTGTRTFVHFDAARSWSENGGDGTDSVFAVALHELGHVLGLGHSAADDAVMNSEPDRALHLGPGDLDGLHSLYGGGEDGPSDLLIRDADGTTRTALRRVAPPECTDFAAFDTDGDGRDELLVWRTDAAGHGSLMVYAFTASCALVRTSGPFVGMTTKGAAVHFAVQPDGSRLIVTTRPDGRRTAQRFDAHGLPVEWVGEAPAKGPDRPMDFDGDGRADTATRPQH